MTTRDISDPVGAEDSRIGAHRELTETPREKSAEILPENTKLRTRPRNRIVKHVTHTFIGRYEGRKDWNTELAKHTGQFQLSLIHQYCSAEKVVFTVTGSRQEIEKLAVSLKGLHGYINLRARLAETKRELGAAISARNARQERLNVLDSAPWYDRNVRGLAIERFRLVEAITVYELKINTLTENLRSLESLLAANEPSIMAST